MQGIKKNTAIPLLAAIGFDLLSGLAIYIKSHFTGHGFMSFGEIYLSSPICYFWLLWTVLIYISAYGLLKDFNFMLYLECEKYPDANAKTVRTYTIYKYVEKYSKKLIIAFLLLPLFQLSISKTSGYDSILICILLLIPAILTIIAYFVSKKKREKLELVVFMVLR